jgi:DNA (cytosine-5)-methyltransferase 1
VNELALFAGAGGGILGGKLLGWNTVCAVEYDAYAASVLVARQNDGCLEPFPVWDDVRTFDGKPWRGIVDVVSGGFPCTDISAAGKGAGITGKQSGLWTEMARIVGEVRPRFVFVENSPLLVKRGLAVVLSDLAEMGYDARWGIVGAYHVGAPHKRDRCWVVAHAERIGLQGRGKEWEAQRSSGLCSGERRNKEENILADTMRQRGRGGTPRLKNAEDAGQSPRRSWRPDWWDTERGLDRAAHGVAHRTHRLKAIGNGQVPAVAALAWRLLGGPTAHNTTQ